MVDWECMRAFHSRVSVSGCPRPHGLVRGSSISPIRVLLHTLPQELAPTLRGGGEERERAWTVRVPGRAWKASGPAAFAPVSGGASRPRGKGEGWDPGGRDPQRDAKGAGASALETWAGETQMRGAAAGGRCGGRGKTRSTERQPRRTPLASDLPVETGAERRLQEQKP